MKRVVAIVGDYYHSCEWAKESLEQALSPYILDGEINLRLCGTNKLKSELAQNPDAVILFKEDRVNPADALIEKWMTEDLAKEIVRYTENGGGWLAWHSGLASYPEGGSYTNMLRGYFEYHPEKHQVVRYIGEGDNAIIQETASFAILDEHYFVHCDEPNTNVFLRSKSVDGQSVAGWFHSFGRGRVCCLTPAHNKEGLLSPEFLTVLGNCTKWVVSQ